MLTEQLTHTSKSSPVLSSTSWALRRYAGVIREDTDAGFITSDVMKLGRYKEAGRGKDVRAQMSTASSDQTAQTSTHIFTFTQGEKLLPSADKTSKSSLKSTLHGLNPHLWLDPQSLLSQNRPRDWFPDFLLFIRRIRASSLHLVRCSDTDTNRQVK